ncbi:MAG: PQQ-binding-like beta-propeller repeat protein [Planctomycetota bacterium]
MFRRVWLFALVVSLLACRSSKPTESSRLGDRRGPSRSGDALDRDPVEQALLSLGIEGAVLRLNVGNVQPDLRVRQAHVLRELILLEGPGSKPRIFALERGTLDARWTADLEEPTRFPASENADTILLISAHYAHALDADTGSRAMRYIGGALNGLERPPLRLPFTPTRGAAAQADTFYLPSLGSPDRNKTLESFSLVTGQMGWGYRTQGLMNTTPIVGGDPRDPRLYFVDSRGVVTCLDANNYANMPAAPRWQELLDNGIEHDMFLTPDTGVAGGGRASSEVGALYCVDVEGVVYCLDRATGQRRWSIATGSAPRGPPRVFGDLCVVKLASGLAGFDAYSGVYELEVASGPDAGSRFVLRGGKVYKMGTAPTDDLHLSDRAIGASQVTLEIEGEVLTVSGAGLRVNDGSATGRVSVYGGDSIRVGETILRLRDRGNAPLWSGLRLDRVVCRVGDRLVVARGNTLHVLDVGSGAAVGGAVPVPGARLLLVNTQDANLYLVAGNAWVYALFPR